ncbi:MAG: class I SAM-dependent methyltransferase [Sphingobium sp.]|nr:class I SAM-dependent methyltransferase [Sphingobium sp.]
MKTLDFTALALPILLLAAAPAIAQSPDPVIAAAVASPDRPAADSARDADRKPAELLAWAGIKPGDKVADFWAGGGYFTRIFSKVVGAKGKVYGIMPSEMIVRRANAGDAIKAIAADPKFSNVVEVETPSSTFALPEPVDLVWTSENYHDVYGGFGADVAARFGAAVFKALKPGGVFIVTDHAALAGSGETAPKTLHRIDPAIVKAQLTAAGFVFEGESKLIANPADPHDKGVFDASIRGKTDQFAYKFRKPAK